MSNGLTLSNVYPGRPNISFYLINHLVGQFKSEAFHFFIIWKGYPPLNRMKNFLIWDANLYPKPYQYPLKMTFHRQIVHVDKLSNWWGSTRCDCPFFVKKNGKNTDHFINPFVIESHRRNDVGMQCLVSDLPMQRPTSPVVPTQPPRPSITPTIPGCKLECSLTLT